MYFIIWIILAVLVALLGEKRKLGFGWSLFWSILLSPVIGLIIVLLSDEKGKGLKFKYKEFHEQGEKNEFKGNYKEAISNYMDALYHLENDYKNSRMTKKSNDMRKNRIEEIKSKIEKIKQNNPDLF